MRLIATFILKLMGWKVEKNYSPDFDKFIIIQAPHTSNWDFVISRYCGPNPTFLV